MDYIIKNGLLTVRLNDGTEYESVLNESGELTIKENRKFFGAENTYRWGDMSLNELSEATVLDGNIKPVAKRIVFHLTTSRALPSETAALKVSDNVYIMLDCICRSVMDSRDKFIGTYEESELREYLKDRVSLFPKELRDRMIPWENGDLLRLPKAEEIFSQQELQDTSIPYDASIEQWDVMKDMRNRIALWENRLQWYWCENKCSASTFAYCNYYGNATRTTATNVSGVRPVFRLKW